ncbi:hypothetical protein ACQ4M4_06555 [Leptolyngbya sp. AN02str]|uniref:hypothetical protein n=1 Tax=Leptolyngbya sp. AN02str TaxID=3423363 RepID=UPI003D312EC7
MKNSQSEASIFDSSTEAYLYSQQEPQFTGVRQYVRHHVQQLLSGDRSSSVEFSIESTSIHDATSPSKQS